MLSADDILLLSINGLQRLSYNCERELKRRTNVQKSCCHAHRSEI